MEENRIKRTLTEPLSLFQMTEVLKAGVLSDEIDLGALAHNAAEQAEEFVRKVSKSRVCTVHFD